MLTYLQLLAAMIFYGVSFVSTKIVLGTFGPITIIAIRLSISAVFLIALDRAIPLETGSVPTRRWPVRADLPAFVLVAALEPTLYFIAENYGLQRVSASVAAIIVATIPVVTALLARPFLGEPIRRYTVIGLCVSIGGVLMIAINPSDSRDFTAFGLMLMGFAVLAAAGYSVGVKRLPPRYRSLTIVKVQSILSVPVISLLGLLVEGPPTQAPSPEVIGHLLYLAVFPSSIAFVFLGAGIRALGANRAMMFTNLIPGITAMTAWLVLGEQFSLRKIIGMAMVVTGVLVAQRIGVSVSPSAEKNRSQARRVTGRR
jgi:drug/metabolite transporter (DMT)-like permease